METIGGLVEPNGLPNLMGTEDKNLPQIKPDEIEVEKRKPVAVTNDELNVNMDFLNKNEPKSEIHVENQNGANKEPQNKECATPSFIQSRRGSTYKPGENDGDYKVDSLYLDSQGRRVRKTIKTEEIYIDGGESEYHQEITTNLGEGLRRSQKRSWREGNQQRVTTCESPGKYDIGYEKDEQGRMTRKSVRVIQGPVYKTSILPPETF